MRLLVVVRYGTRHAAARRAEAISRRRELRPSARAPRAACAAVGRPGGVDALYTFARPSHVTWQATTRPDDGTLTLTGRGGAHRREADGSFWIQIALATSWRLRPALEPAGGGDSCVVASGPTPDPQLGTVSKRRRWQAKSGGSDPPRPTRLLRTPVQHRAPKVLADRGSGAFGVVRQAPHDVYEGLRAGGHGASPDGLTVGLARPPRRTSAADDIQVIRMSDSSRRRERLWSRAVGLGALFIPGPTPAGVAVPPQSAPVSSTWLRGRGFYPHRPDPGQRQG
jgi:hypothetical protein